MFKLSKSHNPNLAKVYEEAKNLIGEIPLVKRRKRRRAIFKFFKFFSYLLLTLALILIIFLGANFLTLIDLYHSASAGKSSLENAAEQIKNQNFKEGIILADQGKQYFEAAGTNIVELQNGLVAKAIPWISDQLIEADYLFKTGEVLADAVKQGASFGKDLEDLIGGGKLTYGQLTAAEKQKILGRIYKAAPEFNGIKANLDLAILNLDHLKFNGILLPLKNQILDLRGKLLKASVVLNQAVPLSELLPPLFGYPAKSTYLVMMQNSDELRPTGGFLGTYGILEIENGEILRFDTHDIYHLDMPVKDLVIVAPPAPIKEYLNNRWYMRDANWSPDWPTAARQIEEFYQLENSKLPPRDRINDFDGKFSGIIAVTPKLVTDLLYLTGPVEVEGEVYTKDNFVDLLQYKVERGYIELGVPSWHRKEVIGQILKVLKIKLFDLPLTDWQETAGILNDNLIKKNLLIYLSDPLLENSVAQQGWAGELKDTVSDYLMVVDANLGSLKTDAVMKRGIEYRLSERSDGLFANLTLNYANLGKEDWKTTTYKTYTRIYVPAGSKLIKASGNSRGQIEAGEELGKTFFAAFLSVAPDEVKSLNFEYKLPDRLNFLAKKGNYSLFVQKQPGKVVETLRIDATMLNAIESYNPLGFAATQKSEVAVSWDTDLNNDKYFIINTSK